METKTDVNGKKIPVSYFGDLESKLQMVQGYGKMFNEMASQSNLPQIDIGKAMKKVIKAHEKFYGEQSKYLGNGSLRDA